MTPLERRGRTIYLVLATLVILVTLRSVALALQADEIRWRHGVFAPLCIVAAVAWLWTGDGWMRWLAGLGCLAESFVPLAAGTRLWMALSDATGPNDQGFFWELMGLPFAFLFGFGLFYAAAGLMFMFWPSLQAFYRYQREGTLGAMVEPIE